MTREEFTGVTFNDLDPSGTRISKSSECSVVNHRSPAQSAYFTNRETTDKIIVYARNTEMMITRKDTQRVFVNLRPLYVTDMPYLEECGR